MDKDDRYTRITLRIPKDLHARLTAAADDTSKSTNAEIVGRLEESFGLPQSAPAKPAQEIVRVQVQLDSSGYPISWDEIHAHLAAINRSGKFDPVDMQVSIKTPELVSSSKRQDEADDLSDFYRKQRRQLSKPTD